MKIAVASTGLGHVRRGIETWAASLAEALHKRGLDVTLFRGTGPLTQLYDRVVWSCPRGSQWNKWLTVLFARLGGWRYGFGSSYQTEQTTFAYGMMRSLREGGFSIVHLQDPWLAWLLEVAGRKGRHDARVILAHGTEEDMEFLSSFRHLQELSPHYRQRHGGELPDGFTRHAIPNFVDTERYRPDGQSGKSKELRAATGIPEDAFVVGCVAAVNKTRKRMDYLIREFAAFADSLSRAGAKASHGPSSACSELCQGVVCRSLSPFLIIAGAREEESGEILQLADEIGQGRVKILFGLPVVEMPEFYRMLDVFVICSTAEIFGIAFLEAMASGLPCIGHRFPVTEWIIGDGGSCVDMLEEGVLEREMRCYADVDLRTKRGALARERAATMFSVEVVVKQILQMYQEVFVDRR